MSYTHEKNVSRRKETGVRWPLSKAARPNLLSGAVLLLALIAAITPEAKGFHFTITGDMRDGHENFGRVLQSINGIAEVNGPGEFLVSPGDIDGTIPENRAVVDTYFGTDFRWYPLIGNHDAETAADMNWLRTEYHTANGSTDRQPLKNYTNQDGPAGSIETTFSWDQGNAHFISLNIYWDGGTAANSDCNMNISGDIVPELYNWLAADLAANTKPFVFVFVHEPAFPYNHHYGDSLDQYPDHRNAFWALLESEKVTAVVCAHTHYYSKHRGDVRGHTYNYPDINSWRTQDPNVAGLYGRVWQIDSGNSGKEPGGITAGPNTADYLPSSLQWNGVTFADVIVDDNLATVNIYRDIHTTSYTDPTLGTQFSLADTIILLPSNAPVISGHILDSNATPIAGVYLSANNNGDYDTTDANGYYEIPVPNGWSGEVTLRKTEYTFDPNGRSYTSVTADIADQNYIGTYTPDITPPSPDPMTWASLPAATGQTSITMTAMSASDDSPPVMYYFECTNHGDANSNWQTDPTYEANGLNPGTEYTFRVKARDSAAAQNETAWATTTSATTLSDPLAWDNFESAGWAGGSGWSGDWNHSGYASLVTSGIPHEGNWHLLLRSYNGIASRTVNITGVTGAHLTFWWKAYSFESVDYATVEVYDGSWHTVLTVINGQDDYIYHPADIDLSGYNMVSNFTIRIASHMSGIGDYFYVDDTEITSAPTPPPPPGQASSPDPADGSTDANITTDLSWTAGSGATSHLVYFGTASPGDFKGNQVATTFDPGILTNFTTYYWRIDEKNAGGITTGTVWSFTTVSSAPIITSTPVTTATINQLYSYDVEATGIPEPTYGLVTSPSGMTIDANTGLISWTPDSNQLGLNAVTVEATNTEGGDTQVFDINVAGIAPVITSTAVLTATVNQPYSYDVEATGIPEPTYGLVTSPAGMTIDANTGLISWTPDSNQLGLNAVTVEATNTEGGDTQAFDINVAGIAPVITSTAVTEATVNQPYSYDVEATGIPEPTYGLVTSPAGMTIDANTGVISWTPDSNQLGLNAVTVEATNTEGGDTQSFTITVLPSDDFDDNRRGAMWRLFAEDYDNLWVSEDANRLNVRATGDANDLVALYVANGWSFDVNENFAIEIDFCHSKISERESWVGISIENDDSYVSISTGSDSNEPYFYYETVVDGNVIFEQEPRDSNDGTLYIWYDANSNNMYLSHIGYEDVNAYDWQTLPNPLQCQWKSPVDVIIGGGSDKASLGPDEACLDNFKIISAELLGWPPATDLDGDGFIGWSDIGMMSEHWLADPNTDPNIKGDINKDEIVNFLDFAELAPAW